MLQGVLFNEGLVGSEKVFPAIGKGGKGDGRPIGKGFLAYPQNMKFGVRVSTGQIGE
jgi:hypothetical protein